MSKSMETVMASSNLFVDIFHLDVVWVGDYADYLLPLNDRINRTVLLAHNEQNVEAGMSLGRLVAVPQAADFGVMFTRMDILNKYGFSRPPQTWTEMESMLSAVVATERKSNPSFIGYIGQLSRYEGMTCNVLEWLKSESAGSILEPNRTLSLLDPRLPNGQRAQNIANRWQTWVRNGWVAVGHDEMSALREWTRGNALFHRNWPFVGAQTRAARVSWPWAVTKLPGAKPGMSGAALGGWMWGVSKATKNPEAAVKVLEWLMSVQFQKIRTMTYGSLPTVKALYDDPDVCTIIGDCNLFRDMQIAHRPSGAAGKEYQNVSISIYDSWYSIVTGAMSATKGLALMNREIADALGIDILGPPTNIHTRTLLPSSLSR
ncbi:hypothetical protein BCR44DRAFT_1498707 [Catenaria anguillulae PL171]|uniref:Periplasmic binding protein-like II n=1 Tax=Catenaria anguillulae PL171 TaxID=765915 RepID=A0A1Y2HPL2_9FUNG|nr:hypothetical protein BCR44DRAFT_1498707 [Catenaria anguillulae PL171]